MDLNMTILYSLPYRITDKDSGEINEGISVYMYGSDNLKPRERVKGNTTVKGSKPIKANLPFKLEHKITQVPGVYTVDMDMEGGQDLKGQMTIIDIDFVGTIEAKIITAPEKK